MTAWWSNFPENKPRRAARDGIRARSRQGKIGESWWSGRFIAALEKLSDPNRLQRGRSYARSGQVMDLKVAPGRVTARVQGSRTTPYRVELAIRPFTTGQWAQVERAMADQALFLAALLAGEMPREIEEAFTAAGHPLFPTEPDDLSTDCSCPDFANPCKHAAAAVYILAERFDEDPFQIFAWRGRAQEELLERLRALRAESARATAAMRPDSPGAGAPHDVDLQDFWRAGPELEQAHAAPRAAAVPDALLRQLGTIGLEVRGTEVSTVLAQAYRVLTTAAERRALGQHGDQSH
jgi:uncharacterized Zn finger protein